MPARVAAVRETPTASACGKWNSERPPPGEEAGALRVEKRRGRRYMASWAMAVAWSRMAARAASGSGIRPLSVR